MGWDEDDYAELDELRAGDEWPDSFGPRLVLICRCHCVEEREIEAMLDEGASLEEIVCRTGASTGCGSCRLQLEGMARARKRV